MRLLTGPAVLSAPRGDHRGHNNVLSDEQIAAALRDLGNSGFVFVDRAEDALQILARLTKVTDQDFTVRFYNPHGAKITAAGRRKLRHNPQR